MQIRTLSFLLGVSAPYTLAGRGRPDVQIEKLAMTYANAVQKGDLASVLATYREDAVMVPAGAERPCGNRTVLS